MKCMGKKVMSIIASLVLGMSLVTFRRVIATPTATLLKSGSAQVGKTVSISVKVSGDGPYGGFNGNVSVDSEYFDITGIRAGNYGASNFSKGKTTFLDYNCNIVSDSTLVVIDLSCKKEGSGKVAVNLEVSSLDGLTSYNVGASANVEVTKPVVLSGNCSLASLSISPGSIYPAFSADTLEYSATVNDSVTSVAVTAKAAHDKAKVSLNGAQSELKMGSNTVKITVTAENGDTKVYKIYIRRGTPTPTPKPYPILKENGVSYTILSKSSLESVPSGFSWSETTYNGEKIPCLVGGDGTLILWLVSDTGKGLYYYDLDKKSLAPCYGYSVSAFQGMFIPFPDDFTCPSGYEKTTVTFDEKEIEAYQNSKNKDLPILVYLVNEEGKTGMYYLDQDSGLVLPFHGEIGELVVEVTPVPTPTLAPTNTPTPTPVPTDTPTPTPAPPVKALDGNNYKTATIVLASVSAVLAIALAVLAVLHFRNPKDPLADSSEDVDNEKEQEVPEEKETEEEREKEKKETLLDFPNSDEE